MEDPVEPMCGPFEEPVAGAQQEEPVRLREVGADTAPT